MARDPLARHRKPADPLSPQQRSIKGALKTLQSEDSTPAQIHHSIRYMMSYVSTVLEQKKGIAVAKSLIAALRKNPNAGLLLMEDPSIAHRLSDIAQEAARARAYVEF